MRIDPVADLPERRRIARFGRRPEIYQVPADVAAIREDSPGEYMITDSPYVRGKLPIGRRLGDRPEIPPLEEVLAALLQEEIKS